MNIKSDTEYIAKTGHTIDADGSVPLEMIAELVRCKDCKFSLANIDDIQDGEDWAICSLSAKLEPNDFCSHGERRTE